MVNFLMASLAGLLGRSGRPGRAPSRSTGQLCRMPLTPVSGVWLLLGLLLLVPWQPSMGDSCDSDLCGPGEFSDLEIDCQNARVRRVSCTQEADPPGTLALLRVAIRCYDDVQGEGQARYTDRMGVLAIDEWINFSDIFDGPVPCEDFQAAARYDRVGGSPLEAQCSTNTGSAPINSCRQANAIELEEIGERFMVYRTILPKQAGTVSRCFTGSDVSSVEVRNSSFTHGYQGVLAGRYICSQVADPLGPIACDGDSAGTRPDKGEYAEATGFNVSPQSFAGLTVNPGSGFDFCCDYEKTEEHADAECETDPKTCSPVDILCSSSVVFAVCEESDGTCSDFDPLNPVMWHGPLIDVEPGDSPEKPSDYANSCFGFDFESLIDAGASEFDADFDFGPATQQPTSNDECTLPTGNGVDADFDGIFDKCDPVVMNAGPANGFLEMTLRHTLRNEEFYSPGTSFTLDDTVRVGGPSGKLAQVISGGENTLVVRVPDLAPPAGGAPSQIEWMKAGGTEFEEAPQQFFHRWYTYVSDGTENGVLGLETFTEEDRRNVNASPTNNYVNANCDPSDEVLTVFPPLDLAIRAAELQPGVFGDSEVYFVSDVDVDGDRNPDANSRLFGFGVQDHRLIGGTNGVAVVGRASALDVKELFSNDAYAYVISSPWANAGRIARVDVTDAGAPGWGMKVSSILWPEGKPLAIRVHQFPGSGDVYAYVTAQVCREGSPGFGPICQIGCGSVARRELYIRVYDVTDPASIALVAQHKIADSEPRCTERPPLENFGLAFNQQRNLLFVANPDEDTVEVLDMNINEILYTIPVGDEPIDVAVVYKGGNPNAERAYVVNRGDQSISRIDVSTMSRLTPDIPFPDTSYLPVAIAARSDGLRLFTADSEHNTVSVFNTDPSASPDPFWFKEIDTGGLTKRLVLMELPSP